jgi:hypothetical protein
MNRKTLFPSGITLAALALLLVLPRNLQAGPPLICHALKIGSSRSLPWATAPGSAHWDSTVANYDLRHLADDTLVLLSPQTPVIVRMETLRRAAIYTQKDRYIAKELLVKLRQRALDSEANGRSDALAWFDYGYLAECYKQTAWMPGSHGEGSVASELAASVDGYAAVEKAIRLRGEDPQMEFAAAMIGLEGPKPGQQEHGRKAVAAASRDPLLAENLATHFIGDRSDVMRIMLTKTTTARN